MTFETTMTVGMVMQSAVLLLAVLRAHVSTRERLARIEARIDYLEAAIERTRR